ncbi:MAG: CDC48 family AAA ATPase [Candidatus Tectomicrobia bacterium]|nr:CDC48 family AAA ATPase [Candidatus Tectomicrobia bacterium]
MATATATRLKVAGLPQQDVGKGIVRLGPDQAGILGLERGDVVEIRGKQSTAAMAFPAFEEDEGLDIVRMDGLMRSNAGIGMGEEVEIVKAAWQEAKRISVAPAKEGLRIAGSGEALRPTLLYRPVTQGDLISTSVFNRRPPDAAGGMPNELLQSMFQSRAFGLMEIRLMVTSTTPKGVVRVTEATQIELASEYQESQDRGPLGVTYDELGGITPVVDKVREMIELPLKHPELFDRLGIEPPKGVLLYGPPGTGKTLLARAVANESEAFFTSINGPEIMGKAYGESEERLRQLFSEAEEKAPAIIFIDELDSIAPKRDEVAGEVERRIVAQLLTLMDGLKARRKVIVIGATNRIDAIDSALRRTGRFDREIEVRIPDREGRLEILQIHTRGMPLDADVELEAIADVTHGYTGSDIAALAKEAALVRLRKIMPTLNLEEQTIPAWVLEALVVDRDDFEEGLKDVQPSALREIVVEIPNVRWEQVGGLQDVKEVLHETVELPLNHPDAFSRLGIRPAKGVLLYGPPGTGKTMVAKAVATEAGANFLTAKGSTLLSKWYGESEKKIAEFFLRARQVSPAILFFDELDALAPVRGGSAGDPQVTERVVNQLLAEMDGMEELRGVVVLGATNRPDRIDPALLRPGRFDEIIYVPIPDDQARHDIFRSQTAGMALAQDVDLDKLVEITERFTGADIAGVCMKAGLYALRENIAIAHITMEHFFRAVKEAVPSVTPEMEREYEKLAREVKQEAVRIGFGVER